MNLTNDARKELVGKLFTAARSIVSLHRLFCAVFDATGCEKFDLIFEEVADALRAVTPNHVADTDAWLDDLLDNTGTEFEEFWNKYYEGSL